MKYIARLNETGKDQTIVNHLTGVSTKIKSLFENDAYSRITGLLHGKEKGSSIKGRVKRKNTSP